MQYIRVSSVVLLATLSGCVEYDINSGVGISGEPNPPDLVIPPQQDRIVQVTTPAVDVLWTIDNSCSMADDQAALTSNFQSFMDYFLGSGLDYHVGVISTDDDDDTHQGKLREIGGQRWIYEDTVDPISVFSAMANMGTTGSGTECGRATTYRAIELRKDEYNAGFIREEAGLHIIVISDEPDHSTETPIGIGEFVQYLSTVKADEDLVTFSSIVHPPGCGFDCAGTDYISVTEEVGGILWPIGNQNWSEVLERLGVQAAGLEHEFFLSQLPVPGTIEVWVDESEFREGEDADWIYHPTRNSVVFHEYVPDPLSEVWITYERLAAQ